MKKKSSRKSVATPQRIPLKFQFPQAISVIVTGSFTNWDEAGIDFDRHDRGVWFVSLELAPGRHEYRLIVDGAWIDVPGAVETVDNPFGSRNAVLVVDAPA